MNTGNMSTRRRQAIVFDLDDTLYPERQYVLSGMRAVAAWAERQWGVPRDRTVDELEEELCNGVANRTFDGWLVRHGLEPARWVSEMVRVYREHTPEIALFADVVPLLRRWRRKYRLGVVTDGYLEVQRRKIAACRLPEYFDAIVCSDELGRDAWKPSTRPFLLVLERLGVAAGDAVYVGDNPVKDFRGAKELGMGTIRIRCPEGLHSHAESASCEDAPATEILQWSDLEDAIAALGWTSAATPVLQVE